MVHALLGRKLGMTQVFDENGTSTPVTVLQVGPCEVLQVKTMETDGYHAVQIGFESKSRNVNKPAAGHFEKYGVAPKRHLREVRLDKEPENKAGEVLTCELFEQVKKVDVSGRTKGKGFAGTIKRHGFSRGPETHGSMNVRQPGSIGMCAFPARVFKGKRMGGHMGNRNFTQRGLKVVAVDAAKNLVLVKGAVPGPTGGLIKVRAAKY